MHQPILHTDRLLLVPLADRHLELEVELDSDREVLRYISGRAHTRDEVVASHARRMALAGTVAGLGYWMAFGTAGGSRPATEEAGDFVGLMMLPPAHGPDQPDDPGVADLGYRLLRRWWRRGLATEASRALVEHAFTTVGVRRVIAQTMAVNAPSRGVMTSLGMAYVRTYFPEWEEPLPSADEGEVEYELTPAGWRALRERGGRSPRRPRA
jgi:RimJ/RimL family protein N-acetyltransferase